MADFNDPLSTQGYLALLASIVENNKAALQWLDNITPLTNLPTGAKRWNESSKKLEEWNGSTWGDLAALFEMKVRNSDQLNGQTEAFYRSASNLNAGSLPAARFNDTSHGTRGGGSLHAAATVSVAGFISASDKSKLDNIEANATADLTGSEILALLLPIDGPGSSLNADLLDNLHASELLDRANHTGTQLMSTISNAGALAILNNVVGGFMVVYTPGNFIEGSEGSLNSAVPLSYTKEIEFKMFRNGTLTTRVGIAGVVGNDTITLYARVYVNGFAVGTERTKNGEVTSWSYWNENINVNDGDLVQIYVKSTAGAQKAGDYYLAIMAHNPIQASVNYTV